MGGIQKILASLAQRPESQSNVHALASLVSLIISLSNLINARQEMSRLSPSGWKEMVRREREMGLQGVHKDFLRRNCSSARGAERPSAMEVPKHLYSYVE